MTFNDNNRPIYLQIADKICDDIMLGTLREEQRIPSVRDYAAMMEVSINTAMRSISYLETSGILQNRRGIGFFVASGAEETIKKMRRDTFLKEECEYFFRKLMTMGFTPLQLRAMYTQYLTDNSK